METVKEKTAEELANEVFPYTEDSNILSLSEARNGFIEGYKYTSLRTEQLQEENEQLKALIGEMFDLTKCGYAHNYGSPDNAKLDMLARAKSIRDKSTITLEDIKNWLH